MFPSASTRGRWFCACVRCGGWRGRRGHGLRDLGTEAVPRGFFCVEDRAAMLADGDAGLDAFAARGAFAQAHRDVRPFAFDAESHRRAAVQIGNFAEGMAARPERVTLADQSMVVGVAAHGSGGEFLGRGALRRRRRFRGRANPAKYPRRFRARRSGTGSGGRRRDRSRRSAR